MDSRGHISKILSLVIFGELERPNELGVVLEDWESDEKKRISCDSTLWVMEKCCWVVMTSYSVVSDFAAHYPNSELCDRGPCLRPSLTWGIPWGTLALSPY